MIDPEMSPADAALALRLLDGSSDGLLLIDATGRIVLTNQAATAMFGYEAGADADSDGLEGRLVESLVPVEHRERHAGHRRMYAADPQRRPMGTELRLFGQHAHGHVFPVEISLSPLTIDGHAHTVATVRDVSERQESQAKLLLHEERERIAYDLHDFVIQRLFAAGMSLQSVTNLIESPVARGRVTAVADEMDDIVRAIRAAIFRIGTHDDAQTLTSHLNTLVAERARHLGFRPELIIDGRVDDLPEFVGDQLVATLTEAVSNIARHSDATNATIRITRTGNTVSLIVRDNGSGLAVAPKPLGRLSNVMWRAAELGGSCSVSPMDPSGIELVWQVPV